MSAAVENRDRNQPVVPPSRVAVVTRTRNRPILLRRAIESVLSQTFQDWRHVIINDGGHPASVDLLAAEFAASYRDRLQVIHNASSMGMQNASNAALRASESEFVTIHDDDDSWEPGFLEKCVARLDREGPESHVQGVVSNTLWIFEEIDTHGRIVELWRQDFPARETVKLLEVAGENRFPPIAFLYRRAAHDRVGYFNEDFSVLGDWDFNLRFLAHYDIGVVPEKLARWHWRQQAGGQDYGNTSTLGVAVHKEMAQRLFNHYMRQDMEGGRTGLGQLMGVSCQIVHLTQRLDELKVQVGKVAETATATLKHTEHLNRITRDMARLWEAKEWLRRGMHIVRDRRCISAERSRAAGGRDLRGQILRLVSELTPDQVLSLDVFDTALLRVLRQPVDVFAFIEPAVQGLLGQPELPFSQSRVAAERVARQRHVQNGCEDVTLDQVYAAWAELTGVAPGDAARVRDLEISAEQRLCYANPMVLEAARAARQRGIRTVFVSDMYLPEAVIRNLLEANGYEAPEVFVSCTEGKTKHSGALFQGVFQKLECPAERILHMGDHAESDHHRPMELGVRTLHVDRSEWGGVPLADQQVALSGTGRTEVLSSVFTGLARKRRLAAGAPGDLWDRLGYELAGPLMYAFVRWIAQRADEHGVRRLFFLSRDGYHLEKAFRACSARWGLGVESVYMYSSRRLLNLARIERLDEAAFHFLLTADPFLRVRDFLERIGLPAEALAAEAARAGLAGLDEVLTHGGGFFRLPERRDAMRRLLAGQEAQILEKASAERRKLLAYFETVGFAPGPMAIVDLGWQASSICSLQDLMRRQDPAYRLRGYYFGTWRSAAPAVGAGCLLDSFFFHLGLPDRRAALLAECVELVEHLFSAPHATVVGLDQTADGWTPVCGQWETTAAQRQHLEKVSRSAMAFVEDMLEYEPARSPHAEPFGYLESVLERVLRHPTRAEAEQLGALPHRDSFGGNAPWRCLAKVPPAARAVFKPGSVREAYERAYWRKGLLAQLGPTERAMV